MDERIWDKFLTERDKTVFAASGYGARAGFGKRPALLVIDVNWAFCGERPEPILESIKRWRTVRRATRHQRVPHRRDCVAQAILADRYAAVAVAAVPSWPSQRVPRTAVEAA